MPKKTIYLMKSHALLKKSNGSLVCVYQDEDKTIKEPYPIENIDKIIIFGNIQITTQAMSLCAMKNIIILKYTVKGRIEYIMYPPEKNVGKNRQEQYKTYFDEKLRLEFAKRIIYSASLNKVILLKRYSHKGKEIIQSTKKIKSYIDNLGGCENLDMLKGYEAIITKEYLSNFNIILKRYDFDKRVRRKPNNEVNTMLSFGYTLLYNEMINSIYEVGLCPFLGFIHEIQDRKPSLALDIAEVFKQPIIDSMIFDLVNNNRITDKAFNKSERVCMLNNLGKKIFINKFENKMMTTFLHRKLNQYKSYRDCFRLEIYKVCKQLNGEAKYDGFRIY